MTDDVKRAIRACLNEADECERRGSPMSAPDLRAHLQMAADALEAVTVAPAVDREALATVLFLSQTYGPHEEKFAALDSLPSLVEPYLVQADRIIASGILRDVRDVQAEALEQAAVEIREQMIADEIAIHGLTYSADLPKRSLTMLNGAHRFMERQRARAQAIREARNA